MLDHRRPASTQDGRMKAMADAVAVLLGGDEIKLAVEQYCQKSKFREFAPARDLWSSNVVQESASIFLATADRRKAEAKIIGAIDTRDAFQDLAREIGYSDIYSRLVDQLSRTTAGLFPDLDKDRIEARISEVLIDHVISSIKASDLSVPVDVLRGNAVCLAYLPSFDNGNDAGTFMTSWWGEVCDATTIKPDSVFIEFLKLANVSKQAWLDAVAERGDDVFNAGDLNETERGQRIADWAMANWSVTGDPLVPVAELVDAVDVCRFGFTPFISFNIDAFKLINRRWDQAMVVTGGILGLHDFVKGSGSPLRFEGSCTLPARPGNFIMQDRMVRNLSNTHGFRTASFGAKVKDSTDKRQTVEVLEAKTAIDIHVAKLDLGALSDFALRSFPQEIEALRNDLDATGLHEDAIDDTLLCTVRNRHAEIIASTRNQTVHAAAIVRADEQAQRIKSMNQAQKLGALIGLHGPELATGIVQELSGVLLGPGM